MLSCFNFMFITDHSYNKENIPPVDQNSTVFNFKPPNIEWLSDLEKSLMAVCVPGATVLNNIDPTNICENHVFNAAVEEMMEKCPILYKVLDKALVDKEPGEYSKIATMATIYSMILHSRNSHLSTIQRLYSAIAIRYHADNKVYINMLLLFFICYAFTL